MTKTVGQRLKEIRTKLSLSQEALGQKIDLSRAAIAAVETDKNNLSQEVLCKLILTLDVSVNYLLAGIGEPFLKNPADQFEDVKADILAEVEEMLRKRGL